MPADFGTEPALTRWMAAVTARPARTVWIFLALLLAVWTLLPALLQHNLPLDVIEQLAWGREWQIVYFKHPPLPAWTVETVATLSGRWPPAQYLTGPLFAVVALFLVWRLGRAMLGELRAMLATLAQAGVVYFTIFTPEFNHNVAMLPFWAALGLLGYRALFVPGSTRSLCWRWMWFGVVAALGMLGKYTTALFLLSLLGFALIHPSIRRIWRGPGPWLALATMLGALLPHLLALWRIGFSPLFFPFQRAPGPGHWFDHIVNPLLFSAAQLGDIAAALLALALLAWRRAGELPALAAGPSLPSEQRAYLAVITWGPFALAVAASGLLGLHLKDMWGYPMWCFISLFVMAELVGPVTRGGVQRFAIVWLIVLAVLPIVFTVQNSFGSWFLRKATRGQFPGRELAQMVEQRWHGVVGNHPLAIVGGDVWLAGNIAVYSRDRPAAFIDADPAKSPWITPAALRQQGAVLIWQEPGPGALLLLQAFPHAEPQPPIELGYVPPLGHAPARFGWAILRPSP